MCFAMAWPWAGPKSNVRRMSKVQRPLQQIETGWRSAGSLCRHATQHCVDCLRYSVSSVQTTRDALAVRRLWSCAHRSDRSLLFQLWSGFSTSVPLLDGSPSTVRSLRRVESPTGAVSDICQHVLRRSSRAERDPRHIRQGHVLIDGALPESAAPLRPACAPSASKSRTSV